MARKPQAQITCKRCGKEFLVANYRKVVATYCSVKCRIAAHKDRYR